MKNKTLLKKRILWVDALRGFAIVLMIVFHFCYDLRYFGYVDWHIPNGSAWWPFRYLILTLFIFTAGLSLSLAHLPQYKPTLFYKRLLQLGLSALMITLMSLVMFPATWIYFGILHFILVASLLGIVLVRRPKLALTTGCAIIIGFWIGLLKNYWPFIWLNQWLPAQTEDFVPFIPWLGVMYIGIGIAGLLPIRSIDLPKNTLTNKIALMGKHGLLIYLLHQPLLFAGFFTVQWLTQ